MSENKMLGRILGSVREEVTRGRRILHIEELYDLYESSNIIRAIKSWKMDSICSPQSGAEKYKILAENLKGRDHLGYLGVAEKIILIYILNKM